MAPAPKREHPAQVEHQEVIRSIMSFCRPTLTAAEVAALDVILKTAETGEGTSFDRILQNDQSRAAYETLQRTIFFEPFDITQSNIDYNDDGVAETHVNTMGDVARLIVHTFDRLARAQRSARLAFDKADIRFTHDIYGSDTPRPGLKTMRALVFASAVEDVGLLTIAYPDATERNAAEQACDLALAEVKAGRSVPRIWEVFPPRAVTIPLWEGGPVVMAMGLSSEAEMVKKTMEFARMVDGEQREDDVQAGRPANSRLLQTLELVKARLTLTPDKAN